MSFVIRETASAYQVAAGLSRSYRRVSAAARRLASKLGLENDFAGADVGALTRSDIVAFKPAECTAAEAMALLQTAGGALEHIETLLERMDGLAREAASPRCGDVRRREHDAGYQKFAGDISRIADETRYADMTLLDGSLTREGGVRIEIGTEPVAGEIVVCIPSLDAGALGLGTQAGGAGGSIATHAAAERAVGAVAAALESVRSVRSDLEETGETLEASLRAVRLQVQNMASCASRIPDADMALDMLEFVHSHVLRQPSVSLLAQTNAPRLAMSLL